MQQWWWVCTLFASSPPSFMLTPPLLASPLPSFMSPHPCLCLPALIHMSLPSFLFPHPHSCHPHPHSHLSAIILISLVCVAFGPLFVLWPPLLLFVVSTTPAATATVAVHAPPLTLNEPWCLPSPSLLAVIQVPVKRIISTLIIYWGLTFVVGDRYL